MALACAVAALAAISAPALLGGHARTRAAPLPGLQAPVTGAAAAGPAPVAAAPAYDWTAGEAGGADVKARSGIVIDPAARKVLWARDAHSRRAPASLTKMMTAMVALDHAGSLDRTVTVPQEATAIEPNVMGLSAGERVDIRTLLYGLFLDSGNDAAETLARVLVPRADFLAEMNSRAARMGLRDTHFSNPTGLDDPGLYSSAFDLALIAAALVQGYPDLVQIAGTKERPIPGEPGAHKAFDPVNLNKLLWTYPGTLGLKTGFTDDAGGCVAAAVQRGGRRLVSVMLHSDVFFTDAGNALDHAFAG